MLTTAQQNQQDLEQLKAVLEEKSSKLEQATAELAKLSAAAATVTSLQENTASLTNELKTGKETIAALEKKVADLQAEIKTLKAEQEQRLKQIMDSDKDGVSDALDSCPETMAGAVVDEKGCERDRDKDGVIDRLDLCPDSSKGATVNSLGCADDNAAIILKGVSFKSGTANLTQSARESLIAIAAILKKSAPDQQFEIAGYTDSIGDPALNKQVSEQRAKAVRVFLIKQGIPANLLIPKGYGFENPIADNSTREGRAKNRRVELHKIMP